MDRIESEEVSNDTTIISELLNSDEVMETSTLQAGDGFSSKTLLQEKHDLRIIPNADSIEQNRGILLQDHNMPSNLSQCSDIDVLNKNIRHVHIPYILNGELYQIQTQDGENVTVKCCHCPPDRVYRGSVRSTGNFHMHIKRRHPDLLEKLHNMKVNALLERRDRLMRNRKITRNNRSQIVNGPIDMYSFKNECSEMTLASAQESSLVHTHKLKIKTVFQRHQMQQREAKEMHNWNSTEYTVMPIDEEFEQPINYSLKAYENNKTPPLISSNVSRANEQSLHQNSESNQHTNQSIFNNSRNLSHQSKIASSTKVEKEQIKILCENHTNNRNSLTSSTSIACSSVTSNSSSNHRYNAECSRACNNLSFQQSNLSLIKPEHLILGAQTEAIDLTMHTDSGIYSNFEDDASENNNNDSISHSRVGTQGSTNINISTNDTEVSGSSTTKWQDLLMQVENSLRGIQREMSIHNQIESNRMFLDIAKFKFLNPSFQFNW